MRSVALILDVCPTVLTETDSVTGQAAPPAAQLTVTATEARVRLSRTPVTRTPAGLAEATCTGPRETGGTGSAGGRTSSARGAAPTRAPADVAGALSPASLRAHTVQVSSAPASAPATT